MTLTQLLTAAGISAATLSGADVLVDRTDAAIAGYQAGLMSALTSSGVTAQDLGMAPGVDLETTSYGEVVEAASGGDVTGVETDAGAWIPFGASGLTDL